MIAETGTPLGSLAAGSSAGLFVIGAVKGLLGGAALRPVWRPISGVHSWPVQSIRRAGGSGVFPSHQTSPSGVGPTLLWMVSPDTAAIAFGWVPRWARGRTPK